MKFGLTQEQFDFVIKHVVEPLTNQGAQVYCYGSRARGDHQQYSDLDLMVESNRPLDALIAEILEALQKSNFPLSVDLVNYRNFAESYKPGYLKDRKLFR